MNIKNVRVRVILYRIAKVPLETLRIVLGFKGDARLVVDKLKSDFGPLANGLKVFHGGESADPQYIVDKPDVVMMGMEAMRFDAQSPKVPYAGVTEADPLDERSVLMLDGALHCELDRFGLSVDPKTHEWVVCYEVY